MGIAETTGRLMRRVRAGHVRSMWADPELHSDTHLALSSSSFEHLKSMNQPHADKQIGQNVSPELRWTDPPSNTATLVLVVEDVDVPLRSPLVHTCALVPPRTPSLAEGVLASERDGVVFVPASLGRTGYRGPAPIPGHGTHHYWFCLYALDVVIDAAERKNHRTLRKAMRGHVVARGALVGLYER